MFNFASLQTSFEAICLRQYFPTHTRSTLFINTLTRVCHGIGSIVFRNMFPILVFGRSGESKCILSFLQKNYIKKSYMFFLSLTAFIPVSI